MDMVEKEYGAELSMLSHGVSILYSNFMQKKKVDERKVMPLRAIVESVAKKEIGPKQVGNDHSSIVVTPDQYTSRLTHIRSIHHINTPSNTPTLSTHPLTHPLTHPPFNLPSHPPTLSTHPPSNTSTLSTHTPFNTPSNTLNSSSQPQQKYMIFEMIICDPDTDDEIEVPYVRLKLR